MFLNILAICPISIIKTSTGNCNIDKFSDRIGTMYNGNPESGVGRVPGSKSHTQAYEVG